MNRPKRTTFLVGDNDLAHGWTNGEAELGQTQRAREREVDVACQESEIDEPFGGTEKCLRVYYIRRWVEGERGVGREGGRIEFISSGRYRFGPD